MVVQPFRTSSSTCWSYLLQIVDHQDLFKPLLVGRDTQESSVPNKFKVGLTSRFFKGSRLDEPDWFFKGTSVYESNVGRWLMGANERYGRMTSDTGMGARVFTN
jgi:hypothetical protein